MKLEYLRRKAVEHGIEWIGKSKKQLEVDLDAFLKSKNQNLYKKTQEDVMEDEKLNRMRELAQEVNRVFRFQGEDMLNEDSFDLNALEEDLRECAQDLRTEDFAPAGFSKKAVGAWKELGVELPEMPKKPIEYGRVNKKKKRKETTPAVEVKEEKVEGTVEEKPEKEKTVETKTEKPVTEKKHMSTYHDRKHIKRACVRILETGERNKKKVRNKLVEEFGDELKKYISNMLYCMGTEKFCAKFGMKTPVDWQRKTMKKGG